jgi:O-antigen/teichoic acid export membrane protein
VNGFKANAAANAGGRFWAAILTIATAPPILQTLGTEAYGLVALFVSIGVLFNVLDLGLSATVNREVARNRSLADNHKNQILLRTLELPYWTIGTAIGIALIVGSGWIARHWISAQHLSGSEIQGAVIVLSIATALRWPVSLYYGVLQGLEHQVRQNVVFIAAVTIRTIGGVLVLRFISPTLSAFLACQLLANLVELVLAVVLAWRAVSGTNVAAAYFDPMLLRQLWKSALGFNLVGTVALVIGQTDRIVISRLLPLSALGSYALASTAAGAVPLIASSIGAALFPQFSGLVATNAVSRLRARYHRSVQTVGVVAVAATIPVALFPRQILAVWTQRPDVASEAALPLMLLAFANLLNGLQNPAYNLLLASGEIATVIRVSTVSAALYIPLMMGVVPVLGIGGAALLWLAQNVLCLIWYPLRAHQRLLKEPLARHFVADVAVALGAGTIAYLGVRALAHGPSTFAEILVSLALAEGAYIGIAIVAMQRLPGPAVRGVAVK